MITYIHIPTPDNKKPIHDFINNKAPYGTTVVKYPQKWC